VLFTPFEFAEARAEGNVGGRKGFGCSGGALVVKIGIGVVGVPEEVIPPGFSVRNFSPCGL